MRRALVLAAVCCAASAGYDAAGIAGDWMINGYKAAISPLQGPNLCNFWPTCSQFTRAAIRETGFIPGVVMGADRLMRCHPGAWSYYDRYYFGLSHDRLCDAVSSHLALQPESAQFPPVYEPAPVAVAPDTSELGFADHLYSSHDFTRAASEYLRLAYSTSGPARAYAGLMAAEALLGAGDYEKSVQTFSGCDRPGFEGPARLGIARARFGQGRYADTRKALAGIEGLEAERRLLAGWSLFREYRFKEAAGLFAVEPAVADLAALDGSGLARRSRLASTLFSAVLPGSGQAYSGRVADGLYSLLTVASAGLATWYFAADPAHRDRTRIKVSLAAAFCALFYAGNVYGANIAARDYNRLQQRLYVAVADELLARQPLAPDYRRVLGLTPVDSLSR